jgi:hypothetical protein
MKNNYKVVFIPANKIVTFTNKKKADRYARDLSRAVYGIVTLQTLRGIEWSTITRYSNGAVTLYR